MQHSRFRPYLVSKEDVTLAWERLYDWQRLGESVIVPLLVCPDDLDFYCTVLVAEQVSSQLAITWNRFGFAKDTELSHDVDWISNVPAAVFDSQTFRRELSTLWAAHEFE
jgi:hypothetical protein